MLDKCLAEFLHQKKHTRHEETVYLEDAQKRFWSKVKKGKDENACWTWKGNILPNGYGNFNFLRRMVAAHRYSYWITYGKISPLLHIDHLCHVRTCVKPTHLEAVSPRVNNLRSNSLSALNARKTKCWKGHLFEQENTYFIRSRNARQCRTCKRIAAKKYYDKNRVKILRKLADARHPEPDRDDQEEGE